jgi:nucleotide-binding universal stress UspA family protein
MFPNALVMIGRDHRDRSVLDAVIDRHHTLGIRRVHLCHIDNRDIVAGPLAALVKPEAPVQPPEVDAAAEHLRAALPPEVEVRVHFLVGPTEVVLCQVVDQEDIDLVVMGRNPSVDGQPGWGSSRRKLLRLTTCSVLVVPQGTRLNLSRVVCGMDFSQYARLALGVACRIADGVDTVYQYDPTAVADGGMKQEQFREHIGQMAWKHLEEKVLPDLCDNPCRPNLIVHPGGQVADVLIRYAGEQPIIMGSRGLSPLAAMLLGSAADRVAGRALGPVLIVRKKGSVLGLLERLVHRG